MKRTYILNITLFALMTGIACSQQTLQAVSETSREMERGTARGEEVAGAPGAIIGGLLGIGTGVAKDTGDVVTGKTGDEDILIEEEYEVEPMIITDEDLDEDIYDIDEVYTNGRSETAKEMEKGAASGEQVAGAPGAIIGGLLGVGVGVAKDTGEAITGEPSDEDIIIEEQYAGEPMVTDDDMYEFDMDMLMTPRSANKNELNISDVE